MRRTFEIFDDEHRESFCDFINFLCARNKKFTVTPRKKTEDENGGFVVWYYI